MYCKKCGNKIEDKIVFCGNCGEKTYPYSNLRKENINSNFVDSSSDIIKCGNCNYIGSGEKTRSVIAIVLAWLCIFIAWPITVIYFLTTNKYRCPKCKSTFLGIKNKDGMFTMKGSKKGGSIIVWIVGGLLLVGVIAVLAGIVILAINPTEQLNETRDAQRRSDVLTILNAIYQYSIDNNGKTPTVKLGSVCDSYGTDAINLKTKLVGNNSIYLTDIPSDPVFGVINISSGYFITKDQAKGTITVCAPNSDTIPIISVTR